MGERGIEIDAATKANRGDGRSQKKIGAWISGFVLILGEFYEFLAFCNNSGFIWGLYPEIP